MKTDNYFFPAKDFEATKHFYDDVLGLAVKFDFSSMGMIAYRIGDDEPALILRDTTRFPDAQPALWIEVEDVAVEDFKMKKKSGRFLFQPFHIPKRWAGGFWGPSGNRLGITDYKT